MTESRVDWWFAPIMAFVGGVAGGFLALTINTAGWGFAWPFLILLTLLGGAGLAVVLKGDNRTAVAAPSIGALTASVIVAVVGVVEMTGR